MPDVLNPGFNFITESPFPVLLFYNPFPNPRPEVDMLCLRKTSPFVFSLKAFICWGGRLAQIPSNHISWALNLAHHGNRRFFLPCFCLPPFYPFFSTGTPKLSIISSSGASVLVPSFHHLCLFLVLSIRLSFFLDVKCTTFVTFSLHW